MSCKYRNYNLYFFFFFFFHIYRLDGKFYAIEPLELFSKQRSNKVSSFMPR